MGDYREVICDVLVVGGGGAGFRAAIGAREKGLNVTLLSKGPLARCGASPMAGADFTLDGNSMNMLGREGDINDSKEKVFNDIVTQGWYLNNQRLVGQYVETAPLLRKDLIDWGVDIKISDQRMIFTSGTGIMDVLLKRARSVGVKLIEDVALLELTKADGRITGGLGLDIRSGEFIHFLAKAVVIATGGWHKGFWPNTGMRDLSGEGIAMAHRAGADIGNMEFITFCCNVFYEPPMWMGSIAPYMLSLICGGRLTNNLGEDILKEYDPYVVQVGTFTEWNKSFISLATMKEVRDGRGLKNGGVHYQRGDASWDFINMVASIVFPNWKYKAIDLSSWAAMLENDIPVEVGPAVEYFDGGIIVNERFETGVGGLFAAGECTLGAFGANRVFSAITEMLVHGKDAGENAADYAKDKEISRPDTDIIMSIKEGAEKPLSRRDGISPPKLRREIQIRAHRKLGPIRNKEELEGFIDFLKGIREDKLKDLATAGKGRIYNKEWLDALELPNIVHLLLSAAKCALLRTESRGVHYREDYPVTDNDNWMVESIVKHSGDGDFEIGARQVSADVMTLPKGKVPYLDMMKKMMEAHSDTGGKH
ncbi:MAG: FAD-binding protein [Deltaproteobacteria bacterium]|nr:FAD-binding protein [Deltaproteobacteria bacterium]